MANILKEISKVLAVTGPIDLSGLKPAPKAAKATATTKAADGIDFAVKDIKRAVGDKYSEEEIDNFVNMSKKLGSKPVLHALMEVIKEGPSKGYDKDEADRLVKLISSTLPYNYCGYVDIEMQEIPYRLNICLSLVAKNYRTEIDIPSHNYVADLFSKYDMLKEIARAYWRSYVEANGNLYKRICDYRPDVDFSELKIDDVTKTTLYFDPSCAKRVGIFCYYVDSKGQPFYKRQK